MSKQKGRLRRALLNNRAIYVAGLGALLGAPSPLLFRTHHNARYKAVELLTCMARAAAANRTLASAAARRRRVLGRHPTPEWFRDCLSRAVPGQAEAVLAASAAARLARLAREGCCAARAWSPLACTTSPAGAGPRRLPRQAPREGRDAVPWEGDDGAVRRSWRADHAGALADGGP